MEGTSVGPQMGPNYNGVAGPLLYAKAHMQSVNFLGRLPSFSLLFLFSSSPFFSFSFGPLRVPNPFRAPRIAGAAGGGSYATDFLQMLQLGSVLLFHLTKLAAVGSCCWNAFLTKRNRYSGRLSTSFDQRSISDFEMIPDIPRAARPCNRSECTWVSACSINEFSNVLMASDFSGVLHKMESGSIFLDEVSDHICLISS